MEASIPTRPVAGWSGSSGERPRTAHDKYHHRWGALDDVFPSQTSFSSRQKVVRQSEHVIRDGEHGRSHPSGQQDSPRTRRQPNVSLEITPSPDRDPAEVGRRAALSAKREISAEDKTRMMLQERRHEAVAAQHQILHKAFLSWTAYVEMVEQQILPRTPPEHDESNAAEQDIADISLERGGDQVAPPEVEQSVSLETRRWHTHDSGTEPPGQRLYEGAVAPSIANIASPRSMERAITISSTPLSTHVRSEAHALDGRMAQTAIRSDELEEAVLAEVVPSLEEEWGWLGDHSHHVARAVRLHTATAHAQGAHDKRYLRDSQPSDSGKTFRGTEDRDNVGNVDHMDGAAPEGGPWGKPTESSSDATRISGREEEPELFNLLGKQTDKAAAAADDEKGASQKENKHPTACSNGEEVGQTKHSSTPEEDAGSEAVDSDTFVHESRDQGKCSVLSDVEFDHGGDLRYCCSIRLVRENQARRRNASVVPSV